MNLKNAKKIVSAYKLACSDGVPPTNDFDWQPSPMGYRMSDLMVACRMVGTSLEELQKIEKKEEPKKVEPPKAEKPQPKKAEKKVEPVVVEEPKVEEKVEISFKDHDNDGTPDYKDPDYKGTIKEQRRQATLKKRNNEKKKSKAKASPKKEN